MTEFEMRRSQRVEVLLRHGDPNVYYQGTVLDPRRQLVQLDDNPHGLEVVEKADIADWRPVVA